MHVEPFLCLYQDGCARYSADNYRGIEDIFGGLDFVWHLAVEENLVAHRHWGVDEDGDYGAIFFGRAILFISLC